MSGRAGGRPTRKGPFQLNELSSVSRGTERYAGAAASGTADLRNKFVLLLAVPLEESRHVNV